MLIIQRSLRVRETKMANKKSKKKSNNLGEIFGFIVEKIRFSGLKGMIAIAAIIIVLLIVIIAAVAGGDQKVSNDVQNGVEYIKHLEQQDVSEVENAIKAIKKAERKAAFESGEIDVWAQFGDTAILGDSRAVGFYVYEFIEQRRVLAAGGDTIRNIPDYVDQLVALNPSNVILCYGLNDISIGYWDTVEAYITELDEMLALLHEKLPNAMVFVNQTIPAIDPAFQRSEKWRSIPDWNVAIKAHCEETGVPYVDLSDTLAENPDLYNDDGIHVPRAFYPLWAIDIITEVYENE